MVFFKRFTCSMIHLSLLVTIKWMSSYSELARYFNGKLGDLERMVKLFLAVAPFSFVITPFAQNFHRRKVLWVSILNRNVTRTHPLRPETLVSNFPLMFCFFYGSEERNLFSINLATPVEENSDQGDHCESWCKHSYSLLWNFSLRRLQIIFTLELNLVLLSTFNSMLSIASVGWRVS